MIYELLLAHFIPQHILATFIPDQHLSTERRGNRQN
jgi:hypothetical protein